MALTKVQKEGIETLINNNANNRIITGSGTANTLEGEANLTFEGGATGDALLNIHAQENATTSEAILKLETSNDFAESVVQAYDSSGIGGSLKYNHGDNAWRFTTNGDSERMRIDSSGKVGIGTTSPTAALSIKGVDTTTGSGGTAALELRQGDANNEFVNLGFQTGSGGPLAVISAVADATGVYPNTTGQLTFNTQVGSGVFERMRIDSSGNVGIGTTSPADRLHVVGPTSMATFEGTGGSAAIVLKDADDGTLCFLQLDGGRFGVATSGSSYSEKLSILPNGNVGIGTTSPSTTLSVINDSNFEGFNVKHSNLTQGVGIGYDHVKSTGSSSNVPLHLRAKGSGGVRIGYDSTNKVRVDSDGLKFNSDTAAANALDDYEEGTFTATCANSVTLYSGVDLCSYTRIGRQVTVRGQVRIYSDNGGQDFIINGLPFANINNGEDSNTSVGAVRTWNVNFGGGDTNDVVAFVSSTNSHIEFWRNRNNTSAERLDADSGSYVAFTVTYFTS